MITNETEAQTQQSLVNKFVSGEWISINEELPEDFKRVIVTLRDDSGDSINYYCDVGFRCKGCWIVDDDITYQVSHWIDFPTPYME